MRSRHPRSFREQLNTLRRQFLQDCDLRREQAQRGAEALRESDLPPVRVSTSLRALRAAVTSTCARKPRCPAR